MVSLSRCAHCRLSHSQAGMLETRGGDGQMVWKEFNVRHILIQAARIPQRVEEPSYSTHLMNVQNGESFATWPAPFRKTGRRPQLVGR